MQYSVDRINRRYEQIGVNISELEDMSIEIIMSKDWEEQE
jgi:hypothetical protein